MGCFLYSQLIIECLPQFGLGGEGREGMEQEMEQQHTEGLLTKGFFFLNVLRGVQTGASHMT
jgi:hypothetical protein